MGGVSLRCLVDSGSCHTLLRLDRFRQVCGKTHRSEYLRPTSELRGIAGGRLAVIGETEVVVDGIQVPITVVVVDGMSYDMLIGDPSMRQGKGILDYSTTTFTWFGRKFRVEQGPCDPAIRMFSIFDVSTKPNRGKQRQPG